MSDILLLHSALGLRPAVTQFADLLRAGGHTVYTPDFYHGIVFEDSAQGLAHRDEVGARELFARVRVGLSQAPDNAVLAGFSLGAAFAQRLAGDRPKARAVVLMHSVAAPRGGGPANPYSCTAMRRTRSSTRRTCRRWAPRSGRPGHRSRTSSWRGGATSSPIWTVRMVTAVRGMRRHSTSSSCWIVRRSDRSLYVR